MPPPTSRRGLIKSLGAMGVAFSSAGCTRIGELVSGETLEFSAKPAVLRRGEVNSDHLTLVSGREVVATSEVDVGVSRKLRVTNYGVTHTLSFLPAMDMWSSSKMTFGDRDAHNVEINATVRDSDESGSGRTITFGDREAHNVEINVTIRDTDSSGEDSLQGLTNVAAGTNLTVQGITNVAAGTNLTIKAICPNCPVRDDAASIQELEGLTKLIATVPFGELITITTPKIDIPGLGRQNPAAEITAEDVIGTWTDKTLASNSPTADVATRELDHIPNRNELFNSGYTGALTGAEDLQIERRGPGVSGSGITNMALASKSIEIRGKSKSQIVARKDELNDDYVFTLGWFSPPRTLIDQVEANHGGLIFEVEPNQLLNHPADCNGSGGCKQFLEREISDWSTRKSG